MNKVQKIHYYVRSYILLGFTLLLGNLMLTGDIIYYLAPKLHMLCYVTLAILVLLTGASLKQAMSGAAEVECDCGGEHRLPRGLWRSVLLYTLFILPLAMGFFLPHKLLGSELAQKKGINLLSGNAKELMAKQSLPNSAPAIDPAVQGNTPPLDSVEAVPSNKLPTAKLTNEADIRKLFQMNDFGDFYTNTAVAMYKQNPIRLDEKLFLDGLTLLDLFPKEFAGHKLETVGFVYRQPDFSQTEFVAARFTVSCCTADANVAGVMVEAANASNFPTDTWVRVVGTLTLTSIDGIEYLNLKAENVEPITAPKDPYVYFSNVGSDTSFTN